MLSAPSQEICRPLSLAMEFAAFPSSSHSVYKRSIANAGLLTDKAGHSPYTAISWLPAKVIHRYGLAATTRQNGELQRVSGDGRRHSCIHVLTDRRSHVHVHAYIYMCVCVCVFRRQHTSRQVRLAAQARWCSTVSYRCVVW